MEDTIGAIQCRISEKYDQKRESLASMHAANQEWLQSAVNEHVKNFNPQGPQITVVGAPAKKAKISESAQKEAEKENAGKQRASRGKRRGLSEQVSHEDCLPPSEEKQAKGKKRNSKRGAATDSTTEKPQDREASNGVVESPQPRKKSKGSKKSSGSAAAEKNEESMEAPPTKTASRKKSREKKEVEAPEPESEPEPVRAAKKTKTAESPSTDKPVKTDLLKMKVPLLKAELEKRGADTKGLKSHLVDRLLQFLVAEWNASKEEAVEEVKEHTDETERPPKNDAPPEAVEVEAQAEPEVQEAPKLADDREVPVEPQQPEEKEPEPTTEPVVEKPKGTAKAAGKGNATNAAVPDVSKLKVTQLRKELKERGADATGLKKDLVQRLEALLAAESKGVEGTAPEEEKEENEPAADEEADVAAVDAVAATAASTAEVETAGAVITEAAPEVASETAAEAERPSDEDEVLTIAPAMQQEITEPEMAAAPQPEEAPVPPAVASPPKPDTEAPKEKSKAKQMASLWENMQQPAAPAPKSKKAAPPPRGVEEKESETKEVVPSEDPPSAPVEEPKANTSAVTAGPTAVPVATEQKEEKKKQPKTIMGILNIKDRLAQLTAPVAKKPKKGSTESADSHARLSNDSQTSSRTSTDSTLYESAEPSPTEPAADDKAHQEQEQREEEQRKAEAEQAAEKARRDAAEVEAAKAAKAEAARLEAEKAAAAQAEAERVEAERVEAAREAVAAKRKAEQDARIEAENARQEAQAAKAEADTKAAMRAKMEARTKKQVEPKASGEDAAAKPGTMNKHDRAAATREKIMKAKAKEAQTVQKTRELEAKKRRELLEDQKRKENEKLEDERRRKRAMEKVAAGNKKLLDNAHGIPTAGTPGSEKKALDQKLVASGVAKPKASPAPMAPPPVPAAPKEEEFVSYEMSPPRDDSEESDEDAPRPAKKIPKWATKKEIPAALENQRHVDPDLIFSTVNTCDLNRIFSKPRQNARFDRRGESGIWDKDGLQMKEVEQYRRMNGWSK